MKSCYEPRRDELVPTSHSVCQYPPQEESSPNEGPCPAIRNFLEITEVDLEDMRNSEFPAAELAIHMLDLTRSLQLLLDTHKVSTGEDVIKNNLEIINGESGKITSYAVRCFPEIDDAVGIACEIDPELYAGKDAPRGSIMRVYLPSNLLLLEVINDATRPLPLAWPPDTDVVRAVEPDVWSSDKPRDVKYWWQEEVAGLAVGSIDYAKSRDWVFWPDMILYKPFDNPEEINGYVRVLQRLLRMLPDEYR